MQSFIHIILFFYVGCAWYSYTVEDEMQRVGDTFHIITNQFPHHGEAYWNRQLQKSQKILQGNPKDIKARNDLAVSYMKLQRYEESLREFEKIEKQQPGLYETYSNFGVLFKKMRKFKLSAKYTRKALEIKPEGHLGLGDLYLKMIEYRSRVEQDGIKPTESFLGILYQHPEADKDPYVHVNHMYNIEHLELLLKADSSFADGFVALGDSLAYRRRMTHMALWAYLRARDLNHPRPDVIEKRINRTYELLEKGAQRNWWQVYIEEKEPLISSIVLELELCKKWLVTFQQVETELLKTHDHVSFSDVEKEMVRRDIHRHKPKVRGIKSRLVPYHYILIGIWVILFIYAIYRKIKNPPQEQPKKEYTSFKFYWR